ncbi:hypothetical protein ACV3J7_07205 [Salmonella enterica]
MSIKSLFKTALPWAVFGAFWVGSWVGDLSATARCAGEIAGLNRQIAGYERAQRSDAEQQNTALAAALEQQTAQQQENDRIAAELRQAKRTIQDQATELKRRINDVVKNDSGFTGIGPGGLREYRAALGYPADLPTYSAGTAGATSETANTSAGLSPADLISHATDYGAYCRSLEAQLLQVRDWETSRSDH